jgi:PTH1 family peptidyl-tRNA hydrolase
MKIVAGLGNPGDEYRLNRHNIGFIILDKFADTRKMSFKKDGNALVAKRSLFKLIKPLTFMNLSGKAVTAISPPSWRGAGVVVEDLLVVCDDIYLPLGEIRLRQSGGDGGHNGLNSIICELETENFNRMRIGVGQPEHSGLLKQYVLEDFSPDELVVLEKTVDFAVQLIDCFIVKGFQAMLNHYSKNKKSYSESKV